jgi:beta-lactamase class A
MRAGLVRKVRVAVASAVVMTAVLGCSGEPRRAIDAAPPLNGSEMDLRFAVLAAEAAPARIGAAVRSLKDGQSWAFEGDRRFPLGDVANAVIAAAALAEIEAGRLRPAETMAIRDQDLSPPPSLIGQAWPGRTTYSADDLLGLTAAGDNTAADVLMKRIGGPGAVGGWLQAKSLPDLSIDRYARQRLPEIAGLDAFRPAWKSQADYAAALAATPPVVRGAALSRRASDQRDAATPIGMTGFMAKLDEGELLGPAASARLRNLLSRSAAPGRIAASLPPGARFTGASNAPADPAAAEAGIIELPGGRRYAVAVFVAGPPIAPKRRDALVTAAAKAVLAGLR